MEAFIEKIKEKAEHHGKEHFRLNKLLEDIQDVCQHDFPEHASRHDSHYEYFECRRCGLVVQDIDLHLYKKEE